MSRNMLHLMMGLPRSGKSTWLHRNNDFHPVVCPDAIRFALHGERFIGVAEQFVWAIATVMVRALFGAGHSDVYVDATNTTRKRRDAWQSDEWDRRILVVGGPEDREICIYRLERDVVDGLLIDKETTADLIVAINRMSEQWEPPSDEEGFHAVEIISSGG